MFWREILQHGVFRSVPESRVGDVSAHWREKMDDYPVWYCEVAMNKKTREYIYKSPYRPLWLGFASALGQEYRRIDNRTFAIKEPLSAKKIENLELEVVESV